jgi:hypothetical protein
MFAPYFHLFRGFGLRTAWILLLGSSSLALASPITIGFISFDTDAPVSGQNEVSVNNLTGLTFGCSVIDGTPVCDDLMLTNVVLTVNYLDLQNNPQQSILTAFASIGPGTGVPPNFIFPGTENITSLVFAATASQASFHLTDNSIFQADPLVLSTPLVPGFVGFSILTVNSAAPSIPEPTSLMLLASGLILGCVKARARLR